MSLPVGHQPANVASLCSWLIRTQHRGALERRVARQAPRPPLRKRPLTGSFPAAILGPVPFGTPCAAGG